MGLGEAVTNPKVLDTAVEELGAITGQRRWSPRRRSRSRCSSCAGPEDRRDGDAAPRSDVRVPRPPGQRSRCRACATSRACRPKSFDGRGNYTLGIREEIIFPEINYDALDKPKGMNITFTTTARTDEQGRALLASPRNAVQELTMAKTVRYAPTDPQVAGCVTRTDASSAAARGRICASSSCAVSASGTSRCAVISPASSSRAGRCRMSMTDPDRRFPVPHPQRHHGAPRGGGCARVQAQAAHRRAAQGRGLHRRLRHARGREA